MNSLNESNCCRTNPFSSKKDEMTVQASSCDERVGTKRETHDVSAARVSSNRNRKQSRKEREKKKMRRSLVDTITSRIHTSAALSDGPRDDPRRLETVRAPLRQASRLSLCDHIAARIIAVQKRDPRDTRKRDQDDRGTRSTFRQKSIPIRERERPKTRTWPISSSSSATSSNDMVVQRR